MPKHNNSRRNNRKYQNSTHTSSSHQDKDASYLKTDENTEKFTEQLCKLHLKLKDVPGDGNCLFYAFSDQLFNTIDRHKELRQNVFLYLSTHKEEMQPFCEQGSWNTMLKQIKKNFTYGDHQSLVALSHCYNVDVVVHQLDSLPSTVAFSKIRSPRTPQVHLAFHNDEHYSSVRSIDDFHFDGRAAVDIRPDDVNKAAQSTCNAPYIDAHKCKCKQQLHSKPFFQSVHIDDDEEEMVFKMQLMELPPH